MILVLSVGGCSSPAWPEGDIFFHAATYNDKQVSFVQSDGSNFETLVLRRFFNNAIWVTENRVFGINPFNPAPGGVGNITELYADLSLRTCYQHTVGEIYDGFIEDGQPRLLVTNHNNELWLFDPDKCEIVEHIFALRGNGLILGASINPISNEISYGIFSRLTQQAEIYIFAPHLDQDQTIASGLFPQWSPDGTQIVYLGSDGIYVLSLEGGDNRLVTPYDYEFGNRLPQPQWSPTGQQLLYHKCREPHYRIDCLDDSNAGIYIFDLTTGIETKIADEGLFPYWRDVGE